MNRASAEENRILFRFAGCLCPLNTPIDTAAADGDAVFGCRATRTSAANNMMSRSTLHNGHNTLACTASHALRITADSRLHIGSCREFKCIILSRPICNDSFSAKGICHPGIYGDIRILPTIGREIQTARGNGSIIIGLDGVFDITRTLHRYCVRIPGEPKSTAIHADEMRILFHAAAQPCAGNGSGWFHNRTVRKIGIAAQRQHGITVGKVTAHSEAHLIEIPQALCRCTFLQDAQFVAHRPCRTALPPVTDPVTGLERQALAVMVQLPFVAAAAGADAIEAAAFANPVHRAVFEAVQAAGGAARALDEVRALAVDGRGREEVERAALARWVEQVRLGAGPEVDAALTALAVVELPVAGRRGAGEGLDADSAERYARDVITSLARMGVNRRLTELRGRQRRMSPQDEGYREVFEEIVGLENKRMQLSMRS